MSRASVARRRVSGSAGLLTLVIGAATVAPMLGSTPAHAADTITRRWEIQLAGWDRSSSPQLADVDRDGVLDIAFGAQDGWLRIVDSDGHALAGWPRQLRIGGTPTAIDSTPGIGDLDNDGVVEIAVGGGSTWQPNQHGGVTVFGANGATRCTYRTRDTHNMWAETGVPDGYTDGVYSSPAIGDVDGDGYADVVFGGWDLWIHAMDRNCKPLRGFPFYANDTVWSSPALYDVDRDGRQEIFIGADWFANGPGDPLSGGRFRRIDWSSGRAVATWTRAARDVYTSSPAIGDIDGDGRLEAVVGGGDFFHHQDGHSVFAYHLDDGSTVPGWPRITSGVTMSSPALGDVTGDGRPEVVIGARDGTVHAFRGNGSLLWKRKPPGSNLNGSPIIADLDGDGDQDVGVANSFAFYLFRGHDGVSLGSVNQVISSESAGAVGDFGADGRQLVTIGFDTPNRLTRLRVFPLPDSSAVDAWPTFGRNARNLRAAPSDRPFVPECHGIANRRSPSTKDRPFVSGPVVDVDTVHGHVVAVNGNGDGRCDVFLHGGGAVSDRTLRGGSKGPVLGATGAVADADLVVPGDFDGDGFGDLVLYGRGAAPDALLRGGPGGVAAGDDVALSIGGDFAFAVPGDFNRDGRGDILWYGRGGAPDLLRLGTRAGFSSGPAIDVRTSFDRAVPGDFNGDRVTDILWYQEGTAGDLLKLGTIYGVFVNGPRTAIDGTFATIAAGDFDGDGYEDAVFYRRGTAADSLRRGRATGGLGPAQPLTIDGSFDALVAGDINGDARADLFGYGTGPAPDRLWYGN